ncbi:MAG TPA: OsmC family protein [Gemmatimonadaceae bacterium]|nr:OsmC family protein [Gemmatimonadaceae bacterium]
MTSTKPEQTASDTGWVTSHIGVNRFRTEIRARSHFLVADEPFAVGGRDDGPTPYDLLLASLGACMAMTLRMYADRKKWPLEDVRVRLRTSSSHAEDCVQCDTAEVGLTTLEYDVELSGPLDDEQRTRILAIAERCPIKQTLGRGVRVVKAR